MGDYLQTVTEVYAQAARQPDPGLCCLPTAVWQLPGLSYPPRMLEMNYGCGSTVDPREIRQEDSIVYVGVGGGLELLQFAYLVRRRGGVIGVDPVAEMRQAAWANLIEAERLNPWFRREFVELREGDALALPLAEQSVTVAAQNCLFNVFRETELRRALSEIYRVLRPQGRFYTSDPVAPEPLPRALTEDNRLRARCISGCPTLETYLAVLSETGFGRIEVRARFPYRVLSPSEFPALKRPVVLESVEIVAHKVSPPSDGPAVFLGETVTYIGADQGWLDEISGTYLPRGVPMPVSRHAAQRLSRLPFIWYTPPTWYARPNGCC
ncbi:MAG: arsenosugar biosynthesis arsenite methyltransferase ArsM [Gemmatales bacterium]|nr:arsenosugar biosynthesis arsenite methyltransferase ArsM [Gemmatales bacterium]MCS7159506.1 arsenosugar biosynthesis arsenite methyltransferase ArsM [Gemmatales bacterium]MDW8174705.1 arsenosugar biosynthesis arsenite methyltransferase ArsM [Gemmatales bacterium]MDW8222869.1 arsenosugar biosynthesis arsenite methyltransferase ArsM [Gemmatales bacterium]